MVVRVQHHIWYCFCFVTRKRIYGNQWIASSPSQQRCQRGAAHLLPNNFSNDIESTNKKIEKNCIFFFQFPSKLASTEKWCASSWEAPRPQCKPYTSRLRMNSTRSRWAREEGNTIVAPRQTIVPSFPLLPMPRAMGTRQESTMKTKMSTASGREKGTEKENPLKYYWNWMEWTLEKDIVNNRQSGETCRARLPVAMHRRRSAAHAAAAAFWTTATVVVAACVRSPAQNDLLKMIKWISLLLLLFVELMKQIKITKIYRT